MRRCHPLCLEDASAPRPSRRRATAACAAATLLAVAGALALPLGAEAAPAKQTQKKAIWGPTAVNGVSQFPIYRDLGVGIYQQVLDWAATARTRPQNARNPADPAYHWPADTDFAIREAKRYGMRVALMLIGTPPWANGGKPPSWAPTDTQAFGDFAEAASRRFRSVHLWLIWGEPSRNGNFAPILPEFKPKFRLNAQQAAAPRRYARLLDRAYGRLKKVSRRNLVIGGNTFTAGDIRPLHWIQYMRLPNGKPPRMDLYGHNPYGLREPDLSKPEVAPTMADFSDLDLLARWLDRYLARGDRNRHLRIFISEYSAPTDVQSYEFNFHVTRAVQARWLRAGLRIARRWSRICTFGWYTLRDAPPRADGMESRTGLIDAAGNRKPAYLAYKRG